MKIKIVGAVSSIEMNLTLWQAIKIRIAGEVYCEKFYELLEKQLNNKDVKSYVDDSLVVSEE